MTSSRIVGSVLLVLLAYPHLARAEGTQQLGANQDVRDDTVLKVDIVKGGEVINISVGNNSADSPDAIQVKVLDPTNKAVPGSPFSVAPGKSGFLRFPDVLPPATITNSLQVTATTPGTYTITFDVANGQWLDPLDVTVTPNKTAAVKPGAPAGGLGRVHSKRWNITGRSFTKGNDNQFYVLVPTSTKTDFTWLLEFNGLAGYGYDVLANQIGLPAPNSGRSSHWSKTSPPVPKYEIYLHVPAVAKGGTTTPSITGFTVAGPAACKQLVIPGLSSSFGFNASAAGTYLLVIDVNKDNIFDPAKGDVGLSGLAKAGANTVVWNGKDSAGKAVPAGSYNAKLMLRLGEFHFVGFDIETVNPGLRIFRVNPPSPSTTPTSTLMFWDDTAVNTAFYKINPVNTLPAGLSSGTFKAKPVCSKPGANNVNAHCWGGFTSDQTLSPGDNTYMDTWVYSHQASAFVKLTIVTAGADSDKDGLTNLAECSTHKTDPNKKDTDGDGLSDGVEVNGTSKTNPLKKDTDGDGIADGVEDSNKNGKLDPGEMNPLKKDTDGDGLADGVEDANKNGKVDKTETDPAKADTDGGGVNDGAEVKAGTDPLDPSDDTSPPDAGMPDATTPDAGMPDAMAADTMTSDTASGDATPAHDTTPGQDTMATDGTTSDATSGADAGVDTGPIVEKTYLYGGGGCSVGADGSAGGLTLALLLLGALFILRRGRKTRRVAGLGAALAVLLLAGAARAQQFPVLNFRPAASTLNYFVTESGQTLPHLSPSAALLLSYAHRPLELYNETRDVVESEVIKYRLNMDLMLAIGFFDRFELGLALPVTLAQDSDDLSSIGGDPGTQLSTGLGDLRIIPKVRLATFGPVSLALLLPLSVPTGSKAEFLGDDSVTFSPRAVASLDTSRVDVGFNVGYRLRKNQSVQVTPAQPKVTIDDELLFSLGVKVALWKETMDLVADAYMAMAVDEQDAEEVPMEVLGGLRFYLPKGFVANVGAGPGITRGAGTPAFRVFAGLGYQYKPSKAPAHPREDPDPDRDGILGSDDACPNEPEDEDGFKDDDGCPDPDNDGDGIADVKDSCPKEAEDKDSFKDDDGCPDSDNDGDGVLDAKDSCPNKPEDKDGFKDDDGCPDPDNDGDGIPDAKDSCPNKPEVFNNVKDEDGCPDKSKGPVRIDRGKISVPPVYFATSKDRILQRSHNNLELVATTLRKNPWIKRIRIEGHTDNQGADALNLDLSRRRAESVLGFLKGKGIAEARLEAKGFGETKPIANNKTAAGRAKNRRVDFVIVDPPQKK